MPQTLGLKVRRRFMVEEQALVVFLRFGSLNSDHKIWMTYTEISKKTGIKIPSQLSIIKRWRRRGFVIFNLKNKGGRCRMLNEEQINWMIYMDTLQIMSHLSLRKRALIVKDKFHLKTFDWSTLRTYYIRHGVGFKRPDYRYYKS
jgi:hypothetical protein